MAAPPFTTTVVNYDGQSLEWDSIPGLNYWIWATTNLSYSMLHIDTQPAVAPATFWVDGAPHPVQKFYRVSLPPTGTNN
jgi:hypothetical protein